MTNGLVLVAALFTAFLLGEILVRALDLAPRRLAALQHQNFILSDNSILKYEYRPGFDGPFDAHALSFAINADGFRDVLYPKPKPAGVKRLILLGDSITAGNGVANLDSTFAKHLERLLNTGAGSNRIEVLNMAVGGYNTLQEAELLRVRGLAYEPDAVAVCFCLNDFAWVSDGGVHARLRKQLEDRGAGDFVRLPASRAAAWTFEHSRLAFSLYALTANALGRDEQRFPVDDLAAGGGDPVAVGLQLLRDLEEAHGLRFILFVVPGLDRPLTKYQYTAIHERVRTVARTTMPEIEVVDLLDDLRRRREDPSPWTFDGLHLTAAGHRAVASVMAPYCESLLAPKPDDDSR